MVSARHAQTASSRTVNPLWWWVIGILATIVVAALAVALSGVWRQTPQVATPPAATASATLPTASPSADPVTLPPPSPTPTPTPTLTLTVAATGDVLTHMPVVASARTAAGTLDFVPLLEPLGQWVSGADLTLCQMEIPVAPPGRSPSGYPVFAAPPEVVPALSQVGFDGCNTATNHAYDQGTAGVVATIDALTSVGMGVSGTARSPEENTAQLYRLTSGSQTVTIAHLAATYSLNGFHLPADEPWLANTPLDPDTLIAQARAAREAGADIVLVSMHAGTEYTTEPNEQQTAVAQALADSGVVDAIIGGHAHWHQPIRKLDGGVDGAGMWVAYGLGNMISNQYPECCGAPSTVGEIYYLTIQKIGDGPARVSGAQWAALTVDQETGHRVRVLSGDTTGALGALTAEQAATRHQLVVDAAGPQAPEASAPPVASGATLTVVPRP